MFVTRIMRQSAALLYEQSRPSRPEDRADKIAAGSAAEYAACVRVPVRQLAAPSSRRSHAVVDNARSANHARLMTAVATVTWNRTDDCSFRPRDTLSDVIAESSTRNPHASLARFAHDLRSFNRWH